MQRLDELKHEWDEFAAQVRAGQLTPDTREALAYWGSYARQSLSRLAMDASTGKISPAQAEQEAERVLSEAVGNVGVNLLSPALLGYVTSMGMTPVAYASQVYRGRK